MLLLVAETVRKWVVSEERDLMDALYATLEICENLALSITQCPKGCGTEFSDALSMRSQSQQVHFSVLSPVVTASICGYKASRDRRDDVECLGCGFYHSMCYVTATRRPAIKVSS